MGGPLQAARDVLERRLDPASAAPLAVAFSGGGDSLGLLLAAVDYGRRHGRPILALHLDHGLQPRSAAWAEQARRTAGRLGAGFRGLRWAGIKPASGLPAAARAARHRLIADAAREAGATVVLVGHTLDDQIENALMRAAGERLGVLREWSPSPVWPEGRGLFLCRPLLAVRRAQIRALLLADGLTWIDDPANADLRHPRARARLRAAAEGSPPPPPAEALSGLAPLCRPAAWGGFEIDAAGLAAAPCGAAARLLQIAAACASGAESLPRPGKAAALAARLTGPESWVATLGGARFEREGGRLAVSREAGEAGRGGLRPLVLAPGRAGVWDGRFEVEAGAAAVRVEALRGQAARLPPADRAALRSVPAAARGALPAVTRIGTGVCGPRLALAAEGAHIDCMGVRTFPLAERRFWAALGVVRKEVETGTNARMANVPPPPYVGAEGKD